MGDDQATDKSVHSKIKLTPSFDRMVAVIEPVAYHQVIIEAVGCGGAGAAVVEVKALRGLVVGKESVLARQSGKVGTAITNVPG